MKTFSAFLLENYDAVLKQHGYENPQKGDDGHITYSKNPADQILIDVPGKEWHHMVKGVVKIVGNIKDDSLERFLAR
jgi:hypothetical protein